MEWNGMILWMGWDGKNECISYLYQTLGISQMAHLETIQPEQMPGLQGHSIIWG